jgi:hypothetical protein
MFQVLSLRFNRQEIRQEKGTVMQTFLFSATEIINRLYVFLLSEVRKPTKILQTTKIETEEFNLIEPFLIEIQNLCEKTNKQFIELSRVFEYKQTCRFNSETFEFTP